VGGFHLLPVRGSIHLRHRHHALAEPLCRRPHLRLPRPPPPHAHDARAGRRRRRGTARTSDSDEGYEPEPGGPANHLAGPVGPEGVPVDSHAGAAERRRLRHGADVGRAAADDRDRPREVALGGGLCARARECVCARAPGSAAPSLAARCATTRAGTAAPRPLPQSAAEDSSGGVSEGGMGWVRARPAAPENGAGLENTSTPPPHLLLRESDEGLGRVVISSGCGDEQRSSGALTDGGGQATRAGNLQPLFAVPRPDCQTWPEIARSRELEGDGDGARRLAKGAGELGGGNRRRVR
jgi:hypothetical protein